MIFNGKVAAAVLVLLTCGALAAHAENLAPRVTVTPVLSTAVTATGQPIVLPSKDARLHVSIFEIPAGARLPMHKHPYPRYAYVLAGNLRVSTGDDSRSFDYTAGDFIVEMLDTWHYGTNTGKDSVRLLVIDQVEGDKSRSNTEIQK